MTTFSISATGGFGIVEQTTGHGEGTPTNTEQSRRRSLMLNRASLVQLAFFVEPRLRTVGGLSRVAFEELDDVIFDEVWPTLSSDLERVSYVLDSVQVEGETLVFRDVTFLFSGLGWDQSPDFTVWRLPGISDDIPWPHVTSRDQPR